MEISANQESRDLPKTTGFACGFIVTVYARFSLESLVSAVKIVIRFFPARRRERRSVEHSVQENQKAKAMPVTWRTQIAQKKGA
jgi:hypothetical protein